MAQRISQNILHELGRDEEVDAAVAGAIIAREKLLPNVTLLVNEIAETLLVQVRASKARAMLTRTMVEHQAEAEVIACLTATCLKISGAVVEGKSSLG